MHSTAIPIDELICQLLDAADGILADTAAVKLIISHEHFLHRDAFRRIITAGTSISTGQPLAVIGWDAALRALEGGLLPCASSEQAILRIAASLGDPESPRVWWRLRIDQRMESCQHHGSIPMSCGSGRSA